MSLSTSTHQLSPCWLVPAHTLPASASLACSRTGTHVPQLPSPSLHSSCLHFCPPVGIKVMTSLSHRLLVGKMLEKTVLGVFFKAQRPGASVELKRTLHFLLLGSKLWSPQGTVHWRGSHVCWRRSLLLYGFRNGVVPGS